MIIAGPWRRVEDEMGVSWLPPDCGQDAVVNASLDLSDIDQQKNGTAGTGQNERGCGLWAIDCEASNVPNEYEILSGVDDWTQSNVDALARSAWESLFNVTLPNDMVRLDQACLYSLTHGSDPEGVGSGPLWPERQSDNHYYLTVHFGGQSITERFGRGHTHALNRWVPHIHRILREQAAVDPTLAAQWLGWLCHEITVDTGTEPNLSVLIPADMYANGFRPIPFGTTYTDNFDDGDLTGWTQDGGVFTNPSTFAQSTDAASWPRLIHTASLSGSNHYSQAKLNHTSSSGVGTWVRRSATTGDVNGGYVGYWRPASTSWRGGRFVSGSFTQVCDGGTDSFSAWDVLKTEINGSTLTLYKNGVSETSGTDTTYATGNYFGLSGTAGTRQWDDAEGADLVTYSMLKRLMLGA